MSDKDFKKTSMLDVFNQHSESLEDAQKKSASESGGKKTEMFRMDKEGKYKVRILPLAPIYDEKKDEYILPRKGYEYPSKELLLKIQVGSSNESKPKFIYVNVRHLKHIFPQLEGADLIDTFVSVVCEKYADDEKLCKSIRDNSYSGGLKYDNKRYMYVLDLDKRDEPIKMLSLSYAQYKELEERKLDLWKELREDDPKALCPICSPTDAYPVEITRKKENGKTSYVFNINTRKPVPVEEEELQKLFEMPRFPEQLYRYSRYHLEATLYFLKQYEEQKDVDILSDSRITELVEKIKLLLPSDDTSHFNPNGSSKDDDNANISNSATTIDDLWDIYNNLTDAGLNDRSEEGQNLRASIIEFIDANNLDVTVSRRSSNLDILEDIEDALKSQHNTSVSQSEPDITDSENEDGYSDRLSEDEEDDEDAPASDPDIEKDARLDRRANRPSRRRR